jgi:hypothetical protein
MTSLANHRLQLTLAQPVCNSSSPDTPMSAVSTPGLKEPVMLRSSCSCSCGLLPPLSAPLLPLAPCSSQPGNNSKPCLIS